MGTQKLVSRFRKEGKLNATGRLNATACSLVIKSDKFLHRHAVWPRLALTCDFLASAL